MLSPLPLLDLRPLQTQAIWSATATAHRFLAELKGLTESLPNQELLLETLSLQEAKDSSEIENIITTHDELYLSADEQDFRSPATKEVKHYVAALRAGSFAVKTSGLIRLETILKVQAELEANVAGLRQVPGTHLRNQQGETIYTPPQSAVEVAELMNNLIMFIHAEDGLDPLLRMAIAHHQFESIHPFYDGNGRTGRILNLLILQREGLLDIPVLYLSRYITSTKAQYYESLQDVRENQSWEAWCLYMLRGIEATSKHAIEFIKIYRQLMRSTKHELREQLPKLYSQDLLNNLFRYPYTKIEFVERELGVSRPTATKYLEQLASVGFVKKQRIGKTNYFVNDKLYRLLTQVGMSRLTGA